MNEKQKKTTDKYRDGWDSIFNNKEAKTEDATKTEFVRFKFQTYGYYRDENGNAVIGVKPDA